MEPMRRALSFALVLLLILRGLLGDAMAMGMTPEQAAPQEIHAASDESHGTHTGQAVERHCCDATGATHAAHPAGCSACGICHSALGVVAWAPAPVSASRHTLRPPRGTQFASVPAAQAIKPPIV